MNISIGLDLVWKLWEVWCFMRLSWLLV